MDNPHIAAGLMGAFISPFAFVISFWLISPTTQATGQHFWAAVMLGSFMLSWVISKATSKVAEEDRRRKGEFK